MASTVVLGGTAVLTASFLDATGAVAPVNIVNWSTIPLDDPTIIGGFIDIIPDTPPAMTATISGIVAGVVVVAATPDTNTSLQVTLNVTVKDTSTGIPVSGTIT